MRDPTGKAPGGATRSLIVTSVLILAIVVIAGSTWMYMTRDWNASGTQKAGSPYSTAPSEGGKPLILNK